MQLMNYLDFELPIKELEDQLSECKILEEKSDVDMTDTCKKIQKKLNIATKEIYGNL